MLTEVEITSRAAGQIRGGSLWIFANEFVTKMKDLTPGLWVNFVSQKSFLGYGYVNPHSLIAGRLASLFPVTDRRAMFCLRLKSADALRDEFKSGGAYRSVFSESDGLPGLIVDVYDKTIIAQLTTLGMDTAKDDLIAAIKEVYQPASIVIRADSSIRALEGAKSFVEVPLGDEEKLREGLVHERDVLFAADFIHGQKTGFFLDQRENRNYLQRNAKGKTVLDLCSYSGGWGLSALVGGAEHVTFVDQSKDALRLVEKGLSLNKISEERATLICADVFEYLEKSGGPGFFDAVVCDPPAFVKSKKNIPQAVRAYGKLNALALKALKPGGILLTCSCSYHLPEAEFLEILKSCLQKAGRVGQVIYTGTQALDHPWVLNRPESKYLKCYALKIV